MTTFYFVRHAHAHWTPDENRPLSAQGSKDATRVAEILQGYPVHAVYSSLAKRAIQTISPFADQRGLPIQIEADLRERKLGEEMFADFFKAVEVTWLDPSFTHFGGESSLVAQKRGLAIVQRLLEQYPEEHIVLSTHGNLLALILQAFDPSIDFAFWKSLSMPDVYKLSVNHAGRGVIQRLWG